MLVTSGHLVTPWIQQDKVYKTLNTYFLFCVGVDGLSLIDSGDGWFFIAWCVGRGGACGSGTDSLLGCGIASRSGGGGCS